ncbi:MAG TPA: exonuclease SbcC [Microlunatus sp.]|nr:exonuclease SbcC [Microlunatus sp.]
MADVGGDFTLTMAELRVVARYVAESADEVLDVFERAAPDDDRPREAIAAARAFVDGAPRSRRQRVAALDAHRAAAEATTERARLAARCAGDAAAAAYLHPIARASQVGHILRAAATVARLAELGADVDADAAARSLQRSRLRATPVLVDVLRRYPRPSTRAGSARVAVLMAELDAALREG